MSAMHAAGHRAAAIGALPADLGAALHLLVVHRLAGIGAGIAHLRAGAAGGCVEGGVAGHEIRRGLADLDAVHHHPHMVRLIMAVLQAIIVERGLAGIAAGPAQLDAFMQGRVGMAMHGGLPS